MIWVAAVLGAIVFILSVAVILLLRERGTLEKKLGNVSSRYERSVEAWSEKRRELQIQIDRWRDRAEDAEAKLCDEEDIEDAIESIIKRRDTDA